MYECSKNFFNFNFDIQYQYVYAYSKNFINLKIKFIPRCEYQYVYAYSKNFIKFFCASRNKSPIALRPVQVTDPCDSKSQFNMYMHIQKIFSTSICIEYSNSLFAMTSDPCKNGGLDFQWDHPVH